MRYREVRADGAYVLRLSTGGDWRAQIERLAEAEGVEAGWFVGLGAVRRAALWYYDQSAGEYRPFEVDEPMEVAACGGNLSLLDGAPFAHTHAVLSDAAGRTVAGHLDAAEVFAGEVVVWAFERPLERVPDPETDLDLWDLPHGS
ncbi:MAG: PPC domain-containing DNA-binding protein [Halobacteriales archaeon]